jgi:3-oxoacyl-[acyl-carrier protein] reductase
MDLGLQGKSALVCGASKGLGRGCAEALAKEGVHVTMVARNAANCELAAKEIRALIHADVVIQVVACDITTPEGRALALAACPQPDILVNNAAGPPTGDFRDWEREQWIAALDANMLTPIELIKATVDGMMARGFGRIINITSSAVKAPIDVLGLSNGARSGLTGFVAGIARKTVAHNVTINNLLPGEGVGSEEFLASRQTLIPAKRFGQPAEFGSFCAFLCSTHASYMTGQNILLDGGAYPGTF